MNKCTQLLPFVQDLFDDPDDRPERLPRLSPGSLKARSPRLSEIAREMAGNEAANYKVIQRFLEETDPQEVLLRLFREEAPFVIGDPTEMPRPQAKKTEYVGHLERWRDQGLLADDAWPRRIMDGRSRVVLWITLPGRSTRMRLLAINITLRPLRRSKNCWESGLWCWIGSSATWNCSKTWFWKG